MEWINEYILHLKDWMQMYILLIWFMGTIISAGVLKRFNNEKIGEGFVFLVCSWPLYLIIWLPFYKLYKLGSEFADKNPPKQ